MQKLLFSTFSYFWFFPKTTISLRPDSSNTTCVSHKLSGPNKSKREHTQEAVLFFYFVSQTAKWRGWGGACQGAARNNEARQRAKRRRQQNHNGSSPSRKIGRPYCPRAGATKQPKHTTSEQDRKAATSPQHNHNGRPQKRKPLDGHAAQGRPRQNNLKTTTTTTPTKQDNQAKTKPLGGRDKNEMKKGVWGEGGP